MELVCKSCNRIISEHGENCKDVKYLHCSCGRMIKNPYYEGNEDDEKEVSYC